MEREVRTTRGKRFTELIGEEADKDRSFWEHATWNEEDDENNSENESYTEIEEIKPDVFDSDFNDSEEEESDNEEEELKKNNKRKINTKNKYIEPKVIKKITPSHSTTTTVSSIPITSSDSNTSNKQSNITKVSKSLKINNEIENILSVKLRKSTTTKTLQHEQARLEANQKIKIIQRPPLPKREFTQKQLLIEALDTEVIPIFFLSFSLFLCVL